MAKYCDSNELELNWHHWLLATSVPVLEPYRVLGLLWTKILGVVRDKESTAIIGPKGTYPDPLYPERAHCLALGTPIFFGSKNGIPGTKAFTVVDNKKKELPRDFLPPLTDLTLLSNSPVHNLTNTFHQLDVTIPDLVINGYVRELPFSVTWHAMLSAIGLMCHGISMKFNLRSEDDQLDLAHDALMQVSNKLVSRKLVYTPGRAPVFNLLTTTIHRCMFSTLNKITKQRKNTHRLAEELQAGIIPVSNRSLRLPTRPIKTYC